MHICVCRYRLTSTADIYTGCHITALSMPWSREKPSKDHISLSGPSIQGDTKDYMKLTLIGKAHVERMNVWIQLGQTGTGLPLTKVACLVLPSVTVMTRTPVLNLTAMLLSDFRGKKDP